MKDVTIPSHIGFIVDGNRRWAKSRGQSSYEGHLAGYKTLKKIAKKSFDSGINYVSAYVFSTENWNRSSDEVERLMGLIMKLLSSDLAMFTKNSIRLRILGSKERLSDEIVKAIDEAESKTKNNQSGTLALCFNYGGQLEIVDAVKKIIADGISGEDITPQMITDNLYAADIPPIDMIVRTSGEQRLSNFMLWRSAYSEIMFIDKMWPDMTTDDISDIINEYSKRSRRFGR